MDEKLNWQKKDKLAFTKILDQINDASNQIVQRELNDIASKIESLAKMGLIQDNKKIEEMREQLNLFKKETS